MEKKKETINDRVRIVRKYLKMSQEDFAKRIKLETSNAISMIERGKNALTGQNIQLICTPGQLKFGVIVNEDWLRNGDDAPMFKAPVPANGRPKLFDESGEELPQDEEELVGIYRQLTPTNRIVAVKHIDVLLEVQSNAAKAEEKGEKGRRVDMSKESG
jgi:transcriptional regulator with XRE-family HTH domain